MKIKVAKEHIAFNKKLIRLDNIETITDKGLLLKNGSLFKLSKNEIIKVLIEINKNATTELI